jgi:hypothetical protein
MSDDLSEFQRLYRQVEADKARISQLESELAELRKDKERVDKISELLIVRGSHALDYGLHTQKFKVGGILGDTLRSALDRARGESK